MNRDFFSLLSWVGPQILIAATVFFAADSAARYQENRDLRRQSEIWTSYAMSSSLQMTEIAVSVHGSEVLLTGSVGSSDERVLAERIALAVDGIKRVDNRLEVDGASSLRPRGKTGQHVFAFVAKNLGRGVMTGKTV